MIFSLVVGRSALATTRRHCVGHGGSVWRDGLVPLAAGRPSTRPPLERIRFHAFCAAAAVAAVGSAIVG